MSLGVPVSHALAKAIAAASRPVVEAARTCPRLVAIATSERAAPAADTPPTHTNPPSATSPTSTTRRTHDRCLGSLPVTATPIRPYCRRRHNALIWSGLAAAPQRALMTPEQIA